LTTTFEKPGTFPKPGPIGRLLRITLGLITLFTAANRAYFGTPELDVVAGDPGFWFAAAISFYFLRDMIEGGFGLSSWGRRSQAVLLLLMVAALIFDLLVYGSVWEPALGVLVNWLMVIAFGYLGPSLLLNGIYATRGCEVRAVWQLVGKLLGRETVEYPCVLFRSLDEWEARRRRHGRGT
jgi:hypothetical protein